MAAASRSSFTPASAASTSALPTAQPPREPISRMTELRFAFRQLVKSPSFTIIAVLALAIGIGANTAIFSVVNAVLLKPLPFPHPEQLVAVGAVNKRDPRVGGGLDSMSFPDFFDFRAQNKSFENLAVYRNDTFALAAAGEAQSLRGQRVSAEFFDVLGREAADRPHLSPRRRSCWRGTEWSHRGFELRVLAAPIQRRIERARRRGSSRWRTASRRRRHAARISIPDRVGPGGRLHDHGRVRDQPDGDKPATEQRGNHSPCAASAASNPASPSRRRGPS